MAGKRAGVLVVAVVLSLGLAASAGYAKAKKVTSEVEVDGWYLDSDDNDFVAVGDVHSNKPKCEKRRTVTVIRNDSTGPETPPEGEGDAVGDVITDKTGDWEFTIETNGGDTPNYMTASVARKEVTRKNGKKLICKADLAPTIPSD